MKSDAKMEKKAEKKAGGQVGGGTVKSASATISSSAAR